MFLTSNQITVWMTIYVILVMLQLAWIIFDRNQYKWLRIVVLVFLPVIGLVGTFTSGVIHFILSSKRASFSS